MGRGQLRGHPVHQRLDRVHHVGGHRTRGAALEPVEVVRRAHPVLAPKAVATPPARHDLLRGHSIADVHTPPALSLLVELHHLTDELVPGHDLRFRPRRPVLVSPELGCSVVALQVARADTHGLDPNQGLTRTRHRDGYLFEAVVTRSVAHHRMHGLGHGSSRTSRCHADHSADHLRASVNKCPALLFSHCRRRPAPAERWEDACVDSSGARGREREEADAATARFPVQLMYEAATLYYLE